MEAAPDDEHIVVTSTSISIACVLEGSPVVQYIYFGEENCVHQHWR